MSRMVVQPTKEMHVPMGPYSHATVVTGGTLVFLGGQQGVDKNQNMLGKDDLKAQVTQLMDIPLAMMPLLRFRTVLMP